MRDSSRRVACQPRLLSRAICLAGLAVGLFAGAGRADAVEDAPAGSRVQWHALTPLPDTIGVAGAYVGVSRGRLIVAGGANFPDGRPWEGAAKRWYADGWVLDDPSDDAWRRRENLLPRPMGYGAAVSWNGRMIGIGGSDAARHYAEVWEIATGGEAGEPRSLPPLPEPRAQHAAALLGDTVYVIAGTAGPDARRASALVWSLDLAAPAARWRRRPPLPGEGRILPGVAVQAGRLFVFGGAALRTGDSGGPTRRYLTDAYAFDPAGDRWAPVAALPEPVAAPPQPAMPLGQTHFLTLGGDDGRDFFRQAELRDDHPGFPERLWTYDTVTDTWSPAGAFPGGTERDGTAGAASDSSGAAGSGAADGARPPVTTGAALWQGRYVVPSGETRPGVRTPRVWAAEALSAPARFGTGNWLVLVAYLASLVAIGGWCSRRNRSADDFFLAGRRVPWWAAGLSIFGTTLSAITYLAIPARSFATGWAALTMNLGILLVAPVVAGIYLPRFRQHGATTAYALLDRRFGRGMRLFGSLTFIAFQIGRMGIVLLLPALALAAATGVDVAVCILVMGCLSTVYTVLGGFEAVVWTDVVQVVVLVGGAIAMLAIVASGLEAGVWQSVAESWERGKLRLYASPTGLVGDALPVLLLAGLFNNALVPYTTDQSTVQRYLATPSDAAARRAIWTNALLAVPATLLFLAVGTALYLFYRQRPEALPALAAMDQLVPWFIATQMPPGLAGLVIAGVFAAAMSSLDSSMHAIATTLSNDVVGPRARHGGDQRSLFRFARRATIGLGVLGTGTALAMSRFEILYLFDFFVAMLGLLGGPLAGVFALAVFTRRVRSADAFAGVIASAAAIVAVNGFTAVDAKLGGAVGFTTCVVVAAALGLRHRFGQAEAAVPAS